MRYVAIILTTLFLTCSDPYLPHPQEMELAKKILQESRIPLVVLSLPILYDKTRKKVGVFPHILAAGKKNISKLYFHLIPYNLVGDKVVSEDPSHTSMYSLKLKVPTASNSEPVKLKVKDIWTSEDIHCVRVNQVEIVYEDFETEVISEPDKLNLISPFHKCPN